MTSRGGFVARLSEGSMVRRLLGLSDGLRVEAGAHALASVLRMRAHLDGFGDAELDECRGCLEVEALASAAAFPDTGAKRAALEPCLDGMRLASSAQEFTHHDVCFHLAVARLSQNRATALVLEALYEALAGPIAGQHRLAFGRTGRTDIVASIAYHERLAEAVVTGNVQAAVDQASARSRDITRPGC